MFLKFLFRLLKKVRIIYARGGFLIQTTFQKNLSGDPGSLFSRKVHG